MEPTRSDATLSGTPVERGVARGCPIDRSIARSLLSAFDRPRCWWADESVTIASGGESTAVTAAGPGRFRTVREEAELIFDRLDVDPSLPHAARPRMFGGFAFSEDHDTEETGVWAGYPGARFVLPAVQVTVTPGECWLTTTAWGPGADERAARRRLDWHARLGSLPDIRPGTPPGIRRRQFTPTREDWSRQIEAAVEQIRRGRLEKVVLAQSLTVTARRPIVVPDVLSRLGRQYPDCYRFLFEPEAGATFFGATPERLVSVDGDRVETEALAGSIARGDANATDEEYAERLLDSEKNSHEHELVVDAICEQLRGLTTEPRIGERSVRTLATVQHLETPLSARLLDDEHVLTLVEALHPTPAVGGLPPGIARRTIRETETFRRGWYSAPIGWFDADGNGTFAVAIRSGIATDRTATLFAGAGIVADSQPGRECEELQLKYRPILDELA